MGLEVGEVGHVGIFLHVKYRGVYLFFLKWYIIVIHKTGVHYVIFVHVHNLINLFP